MRHLMIAMMVVGALALGSVITGAMMSGDVETPGSIPKEGCTNSDLLATIALRKASVQVGEAIRGVVLAYNPGETEATFQLRESSEEVYSVGAPRDHYTVGTTNFDGPSTTAIQPGESSVLSSTGWGRALAPGLFIAKWSANGLCAFQLFEIYT